MAGLRVNLAETLSLASGGNGLPHYEAVPDAALILGAIRDEVQRWKDILSTGVFRGLSGDRGRFAPASNDGAGAR